TSRLMARIGAVSLVLFGLGLAVALELSIREAWFRTERSFAASLQTVAGAAAEALWTNDRAQAERLVHGLAGRELVRGAVLRSADGERIAAAEEAVFGTGRLSRSLLTGERPDLTQRRILVRIGSLPGEAAQAVGALE